jgi:hypothetical protein
MAAAASHGESMAQFAHLLQGYVKSVEGSAFRQVGESETHSQLRPTRVLVIATDELTAPDVIGELKRCLYEEGPAEAMIVEPAVEKSAFHHALGDVDAATDEASQRLEASLAELRRTGISALGEVGDSDPLIAAEDALRRYPADEILIVARADNQARWFEDGLFERAQETLYPPLRLIGIRREEEGGEAHLAGIETVGPGRKPAHIEHELTLSPNLPRLTRGDLIGIVVAIVGTIVAIVLAATGPDAESGAGAAQILIAMTVALINMAHVVGLTLLESVGHRGGWQRFFRNLSMTATPLAIVANALLSVLG